MYTNFDKTSALHRSMQFRIFLVTEGLTLAHLFRLPISHYHEVTENFFWMATIIFHGNCIIHFFMLDLLTHLEPKYILQSRLTN